MLSKAILIGHLGQDPEVKALNNGRKLVSLSLATTKRWKDKGGEKCEQTSWHRVVVFAEPLIEFCEKYLKKGAKIYVEGELLVRQYEDDDGHKRSLTEIVLSPFHSVLISLDRREGEGRPPEGATDDYDGYM